MEMIGSAPGREGVRVRSQEGEAFTGPERP